MMAVLKKTVIPGIGILVILWVFLSGGCMITEKDYLRGAEKYLKKKYGEEFEGLYGFEAAGYVMHLSPKVKPEWKVSVRYEKEGGKITFHDNYVAFQLKPEIEQMIEEIAYSFYGECKVYLIPMGVPLEDSWTKETSLYEFGLLGAFGIEIFVYDDIGDDKEEKFYRFLNECLKKDFRGFRMKIYYMPKEEFDNINETSIDYINSKSLYILRGSTAYDEKNETGGYGIIRWVEGEGKTNEQ